MMKQDQYEYEEDDFESVSNCSSHFDKSKQNQQTKIQKQQVNEFIQQQYQKPDSRINRSRQSNYSYTNDNEQNFRSSRDVEKFLQSQKNNNSKYKEKSQEDLKLPRINPKQMNQRAFVTQNNDSDHGIHQDHYIKNSYSQINNHQPKVYQQSTIESNQKYYLQKSYQMKKNQSEQIIPQNSQLIIQSIQSKRQQNLKPRYLSVDKTQSRNRSNNISVLSMRGVNQSSNAQQKYKINRAVTQYSQLNFEKTGLLYQKSESQLQQINQNLRDQLKKINFDLTERVRNYISVPKKNNNISNRYIQKADQKAPDNEMKKIEAQIKTNVQILSGLHKEVDHLSKKFDKYANNSYAESVDAQINAIQQKIKKMKQEKREYEINQKKNEIDIKNQEDYNNSDAKMKEINSVQTMILVHKRKVIQAKKQFKEICEQEQEINQLYFDQCIKYDRLKVLAQKYNVQAEPLKPKQQQLNDTHQNCVQTYKLVQKEMKIQSRSYKQKINQIKKEIKHLLVTNEKIQDDINYRDAQARHMEDLLGKRIEDGNLDPNDLIKEFQKFKMLYNIFEEEFETASMISESVSEHEQQVGDKGLSRPESPDQIDAIQKQNQSQEQSIQNQVDQKDLNEQIKKKNDDIVKNLKNHENQVLNQIKEIQQEIKQNAKQSEIIENKETEPKVEQLAFQKPKFKMAKKSENQQNKFNPQQELKQNPNNQENNEKLDSQQEPQKEFIFSQNKNTLDVPKLNLKLNEPEQGLNQNKLIPLPETQSTSLQIPEQNSQPKMFNFAKRNQENQLQDKTNIPNKQQEETSQVVQQNTSNIEEYDPFKGPNSRIKRNQQKKQQQIKQPPEDQISFNPQIIGEKPNYDQQDDKNYKIWTTNQVGVQDDGQKIDKIDVQEQGLGWGNGEGFKKESVLDGKLKENGFTTNERRLKINNAPKLASNKHQNPENLFDDLLD